MTTKHLVDPELLPGLDALPAFTFSAETLPQMRAAMADMVRLQGEAKLPDDMLVDERFVPGPAGAPEVRVITYQLKNSGTARPAFLHMHGGGYVMGAPDRTDPQLLKMVREIGCVAVSVDYRLAPENPHPAPLEDCYAALKWLHAEAASLGVDPTRIAIGGESAGGGLAAALALLARDRGEVPVVFQLLIYPMLDDRTVVRDPHPFTGEFVWNAGSNRFGWQSLLGREPGSAGISPYAAASRAETLAGLPPAFINVGALDLFLDEDIDYAQRLMRAGVPVELHVYPGAYHGFRVVVEADVTQRFLADARHALKRALTGRS